MHLIRCVLGLKRDAELLFKYEAAVLPEKNSRMVHDGQSYLIAGITHVTQTIDRGTSRERVKLGYVQLELLK